MKGNAGCHTYSDQGKNNHDNIAWNSNNTEYCIHQRNIGKRILCLLNSKADCKGLNGGSCLVNPS